MKNVRNWIGVLAMFALAIFVYSCSSDKVEPAITGSSSAAQNGGRVITYESAGSLHNELVSGYAQYNNRSDTFTSLQNLSLDYDNFIRLNYPEFNFDSEVDYEQFMNSFVSNPSRNDLYSHFGDRLNQRFVNGEISEDLYLGFKSIIENPTLENADNVYSEMQSNPNINESEQQLITMSISIRNSSEELWSEGGGVVPNAPDQSSCDGGSLSNTDAIIIGDAIGGMLWGFSGPIGGAVAMAVYSIAVHHSC